MPLVALGLLALVQVGVEKSAQRFARTPRSNPRRACRGRCHFLGRLLALALGILDDRRALLLQSSWLCSSGRVGRLLGWGFGVGVCRTKVSVVVSLLWIVAVTNAINFIDNMDGLAGGLVRGGDGVWLRHV